MRRDGFDPNVVSDKLYFLDCTKGQYVELNVELHRSIVSGKQKLWDYCQPPPRSLTTPPSTALKPHPLITPPLVTSAKTVRGRRNAFWPHIQVPVDSFIHSFSKSTSLTTEMGLRWCSAILKTKQKRRIQKNKQFSKQEYKNKRQGKAQKDQIHVYQMVKLSLCLSCTMLAWLQESGLTHIHFDGSDKRLPSYMRPQALTKPCGSTCNTNPALAAHLSAAMSWSMLFISMCTKYI